MIEVVRKKSVRYILPDLSDMEFVLFSYACEIAIRKGFPLMEISDIQSKFNNHFLSGQQVFNYFESIHRKGYINRKIRLTSSGKREYLFSITFAGFDSYLKEKNINLTPIISEVKKVLQTQKPEENVIIKSALIAKKLNQPVIIINHILEKLKDEKKLTLVKSFRGNWKVNEVIN